MSELTSYLKDQTEYIIQRLDKLIGDCRQLRDSCTLHNSNRRDSIKREYRWILGILIILFLSVIGYSFHLIDNLGEKIEKQSEKIIQLENKIISYETISKQMKDVRIEE